MKSNIINLLDFERINHLLEGFNKTTGFVTAILDLDGNVLSRSGWRSVCTDFHRVNKKTAKRCTVSDTVLANKMASGENYHFYKCLNGLVDVAVPLIINGEHVANLFSGQFFFEKPDLGKFKKQAEEHGFDIEQYMKALAEVPVFSEDRVMPAMDFLLNMTAMIAEMTMQRMEQIQLNKAIQESEMYNRALFEESASGLALTSMDGKLIDINSAFASIIGRSIDETKKLSYWDITPVKYQEMEQKQLETLNKTGKYGPYEKEYIHRDGHLVPVKLQGLIIERKNEKFIWSTVEDISERKIAEAKNREKDLQFRKLSANVPDLIYQFTRKPDGSYCVPVSSDGIRNIFGCSPEDVLEDFTPIGNVIHPDDVQRVIADIEYSAKHLTYFTCEFRVKIPGRAVQWIFSRSNPEKLPDGSITWYGFNADITQRKEFEDALRESEGKFRKIYEEGPYGMVLVNSDYKFIMTNRTFCEITGYSESELMELTFRDITYSEDRNLGLDSIRKLINGEIPVFKSEKRYVRKDGTIIWGAITVAANFDKEGKFLYNLAIVEDITGRKQAEEKINNLNERLQLLVEAIQELSVSASIESIMATVRTSARKLLNADGSTFILREGDNCYYADEDTIKPLWKGQRFPLTDCISGWAMLNKESVVIEDIYNDKRVPTETYRSTYVKSMAVAPIRISNPLGAIGAYWSSHYLPSEMEVKLLNTLADAAAKAVENVQLIDNLERIISERTSQLQAANKELETFTYSVSHDLKAPLRGIDGYSKLLADLYGNKLNEEAMHFIATIRSSTLQMNQLIEDLLQYSRLERSNMQIKPLKIRSVIDAILKMNEEEITSSQFRVSVEVPDVKLNVDNNGIQIALRNLIENAIKFTKKKTNPQIVIKLVEDREQWIISVADNGIGFDMKYKERIFEIFQRLQRAEDFPGTGIGLAMVAKSVQRMNGKVYADSIPGEGSTFYLEIPKSNQLWNENL